MDLYQKIKTVPSNPGVYLYKNAEGEVIYVGKAKNLRARVRSYFVEGASEDAKTGSLLREAVDIEYIVVDNEREALALENNLIKQKKPRYNILLHDDKTYPYVKLTAERYPRVYVTRKLRKDGATYYGPYFPANLAYRIVDLIHRSFLIPSCKIDLTRDHPRPCLQFHIKRCLGPCVKELTTPEIYSEAVKDVRLLLEGKPTELSGSLRERMERAAAEMQFEMAAKYRDLIVTVEQLHEKQRMAAAEGDDIDVLSYHYENHLLAVNLFHMRGGKVLDRREFFWEELGELEPAVGFEVGEFFSTLLKQLYLDAPYIPRTIYVPVEFEDREALEELLSEKRGSRVYIEVPQRGDKRSLIDLVGNNAKQSYDQRFRVMKPRTDVLKSALQDVFQLPELPTRIECFDISHIQGAETVASMVVWEDGQDEERGLPQVHHPHGGGDRRFQVDARGGDAPLQTACGTKRQADAFAGAGRRRTGTVARGGPGAGRAGTGGAAAGFDRQAGGDSVSLWAGGRADRAGPSLAGAAADSADSR